MRHPKWLSYTRAYVMLLATRGHQGPTVRDLWRADLGTARRCYACFKNTLSVANTCTLSVTEDVSENGRDKPGVGVPSVHCTSAATFDSRAKYSVPMQ